MRYTNPRLLYFTLLTSVTANLASILPYHAMEVIKALSQYALLPAGLHVGQPCRYCFYSVVQKWVFRPAGATRCPDKCEIWHLVRSPVPNFTFIGAEMWEYSPKTVKISNFGHKVAPKGSFVCPIFNEILRF